jgi:hypothetical protein
MRLLCPEVIFIDRLDREYERMPGRPRKVSEADRAKIAERYRLWQENTPKRICEDYGITMNTLRKYVRA